MTTRIYDASAPYLKLGAISEPENILYRRARFESNSDSIIKMDIGAASALLRKKAVETEALGGDVYGVDLLEWQSLKDLVSLISSIPSALPRRSLVTALVPFEDHDLLEQFQRVGALVKGANIAWGFPKEEIPEFEPDRRFQSSLLDNSALEDFSRCVTASYSTYRSHYHSDPALANRASEVYTLQVARALQNGVRIIISRDLDKPSILGFSTLDEHAELNTFLGRSAVVEIGVSGVDPIARRSGIYGSNVRAALSMLRSEPFEYLIFGTAANNFSIQKAWMGMGLFRPLRFTYRLHWWCGGR